jgi:hypothetical protein
VPTESILVAAAFPKPDEAEAAVRELGQAGFGQGDISLMYTDPGRVTEQGLLHGALFGGVIGGLVGLLFPPLGIIIAAGPLLGPLAAGLAGAGTLAVAGAALGGLTNGLLALGMPREMATRFAGHVHRGDALVVVHAAPDQAPAARAILERHHPRTAETGEAQQAAAREGGSATAPDGTSGRQVSTAATAPGDAPPVSSTPGQFTRNAAEARTQADDVALQTDAPVVATNELDTIPAASRYNTEGEPPDGRDKPLDR